MTAFLSFLAALFSGVLAFKAFGNRKPVVFHAAQSNKRFAVFFINPNLEHSVLLSQIINESGDNDLLFSMVPESDDHAWTREAINQQELQPLGRQTHIGRYIRPGSQVIFVTSLGTERVGAPMIRFDVERDSCNLFASLPIFHIVVRAAPFKRRWENLSTPLAKQWRKFAKYSLEEDNQ